MERERGKGNRRPPFTFSSRPSTLCTLQSFISGSHLQAQEFNNNTLICYLAISSQLKNALSLFPG